MLHQLKRLCFSALFLILAAGSQLSAASRPDSLTVRGDGNGDGLIDFLDIAPFITALASPSVYAQQFPSIDPIEALDMNSDGALDFADIAGMIAALSLDVQPPTNLEVVPSGDAGSISLTWSDSSTEEVDCYEIHYGTSATNLTNVIRVGNVSSATVAGLGSNQMWQVAVVAVTAGRKSQTADATLSAESSAGINVVPLFDAGTVLEPDTTEETPAALITRLSDRVRDRHAREGMFQAYDHYLSWYWEQRMMNLEIVDRVGRNGGTDITFNYTTERQLNPAEFRTFYRGITTLAEYSHNQIASLVSTHPSTTTPGETNYNYSASISLNTQFNRPLQVGDRVEIEISQFLLAPRNGRSNYYGTTMLYIVGEGLMPWAQGQDLGYDGGVVGNVNQSLDSYPLPTRALLGGQTTTHYQYSNEPEHAFKQTAGNLAPRSGFDFMLGRRLHHTNFASGAHSEPGNPTFAAQIGKIGPQFIAHSCIDCHVNNGRALPPAIGQMMVSTNMKVGSDSRGTPHPLLGSVFQPRSSGSAAHDGSVTIDSYQASTGQYSDGTSYSLRKPNYAFSGSPPSHFSARLAPALVGLGLLEAISESSILAFADPADADGDGISGRPQIITDPTTGEPRIGRFGYKGSHARVAHQIAGALNGDMGIASSVFPALDAGAATNATLSDSDLDLMNRYTALLALQARRDLDSADALRGETLFAGAGCVECHRAQFTTSEHHPMAELRNQTIHPYSDLLLHDLGPAMADNMGEGIAGGSEWRTAALWNLGHSAEVNEVGEAYLHDGRARTLEEAILWHGGEAETAKENFRNMSAADRAALIAFLKSL